MEHTKTPWEIAEYDNDKMTPTTTIIGKTRNGNNVFVAKADVNYDAAFIVKACNNFDSLLEGCIAACRMLCTRYTAGELRESEDWAIIDAAIDKTKGE